MGECTTQAAILLKPPPRQSRCASRDYSQRAPPQRRYRCYWAPYTQTATGLRTILTRCLTYTTGGQTDIPEAVADLVMHDFIAAFEMYRHGAVAEFRHSHRTGVLHSRPPSSHSLLARPAGDAFPEQTVPFVIGVVVAIAAATDVSPNLGK